MPRIHLVTFCLIGTNVFGFPQEEATQAITQSADVDRPHGSKRASLKGDQLWHG